MSENLKELHESLTRNVEKCRTEFVEASRAMSTLFTEYADQAEAGDTSNPRLWTLVEFSNIRRTIKQLDEATAQVRVTQCLLYNTQADESAR